MSILLATTTITVSTPFVEEDWGGAPSYSTFVPIATGIRAHLSAPSGAAVAASEGSSVGIQYTLLCDPSAPIESNSLITDDRTGDVYQVDWWQSRPEPLAHIVAGVSRSASVS